MRSLSLAVMLLLLLLLRIAYGSTEEGEELRPSVTPSIAECNFASGDCTQKEECLGQLCPRLCHSGTEVGSGIDDCLNAVPESYTNETPRKRGSFTKNSFLFMKLHPVLNRAIDPNLINVPTRYRRIGVRLGSEFLGKRSGGMEEEFNRGRRLPGTELLGKRHGSEMLGKRNVEMLGKRGGEFLGKRGTEFLGKRGNEFLGKRNEFLGKRNEFLGKRNEFLGKRNEFLGKRNEFLGKRGTEFLGKRGNEFLGKRSNEFLGKRGNEFLGKRNWDTNGLRMLSCRDGDDCYVKGLTPESKLFLQYFKVTEGTEVDAPEVEYHGRSNPPNRLQPAQIHQSPLYFLEKL